LAQAIGLEGRSLETTTLLVSTRCENVKIEPDG